MPDLTAQTPARFDFTGGWPVFPFLACLRYLPVPVLSAQVPDNDYPSHLPDLTAQVDGQFPLSQLPLKIYVYLYVEHSWLPDRDFPSHLSDLTAPVGG
ncbi:hypothetical protein L3X38_011910 [Prunus dulcis]|uniref:Uncharacterized protein n=1 Tax=Prunus dulcis TaxID=3755 RepID=A0AAD4ZG51_PRUDU|nr:hypothetical protein L3X38_011910 [Prunus dulcis]